MKTIAMRHLVVSWACAFNRRLLSTGFVAMLCTAFWASDVSAQLAWAPQQNISGVGTSVGPSIAVFQNRLYAAWKGINGDQGIWWSSFDGANWAPQQNISGVGSSVGPSLAVYQGQLYAAWKGMSGDQGIWWSSFDGANWAPQQNISDVGTSVGPSLAVFQNQLYAAWKGINNDQGIWWSSASPAPSTCAFCNDGSCQCGNQTGPQLCASHGGRNATIGCIQQQ